MDANEYGKNEGNSGNAHQYWANVGEYKNEDENL